MYRLVTFKLPPSLVPEPGAPKLNSKTYAHLLKDVTELNPSAPPELAEIIRRCLGFNPDQRPERMSEIQGALDRIADQLGPADDDDEEFG
jgi:serine/threonine protein kinase